MATIKTQVESEDDRPRMTFRVSHELARELRRGARKRKIKIPDYLAILVQRGYDAQRKGAA